ncbi:MAG: putative transcriptional regulator/DNA-binding XRE family transcriptional regulator [Ascidiaceihabitans sp.]|jgi:predicted transcriptional regulator/DNA-binding XRE family transcriptional regulator
MAREGLTGSRIRERRGIAGLKQAELANMVGISASYLNLIEHNRRRIGGKLLLNIAATLGVEPSALTEGAEAALIANLRVAASDVNLPNVEVDRAEEFAGRFPGWAEVLSAAHRRIGTLERTVETLSDRLTHDPKLAASVHELLSTAAAIRSTASILADGKEITPEWRDRFHGNLDQDSRRLADSSKALVTYLDTHEGSSPVQTISSPQEEVEAFFEVNNYSFVDIEEGKVKVADVIDQADQLGSVAARHIATGILQQISTDAQAVNLTALRVQIEHDGLDPIALATHFQVGVPLILRRLGALPDLKAGIVVCDRSGSLLFRKATTGFAIPRFGAVCPLWPIFDVLGNAGQVLRRRVIQAGRSETEFECFSVAEPVVTLGYNSVPLMQATMLIVPIQSTQNIAASGIDEIGSTCRVCPRAKCPARREPSILSEGF